MFVTKYSRINTTMCPGQYLSVIYVSDGEGACVSLIQVANTIREDRESLDGVAIASEDNDPLNIDDLYTVIKNVKQPNLDMILVTEGRGFRNLDDLVGAGYINFVNFVMDSTPDKEQRDCIKLLTDAGCPYMITLTMIPGRVSEQSMKDMMEVIHSCKRLVLLPFDPAKCRNPTVAGTKPFSKKEMMSLAALAKGAAVDVIMV